MESASVMAGRARSHRPLSRRGPLAKVRAWLPRGRTLPHELWLQRHRWLSVLVVLHVPALFAVAVGYGQPPAHAAWESMLPATFALLGCVNGFGRRVRSCLVAVGMLTCSALLVHFTHGLIEAHFHFFVMIPLLALYEDWMSFGLAFAYVLLHHGIASVADASAVFNHQAAVEHPWRWAAVHAFFVAGAGFASVVAWRLNERARAAAQRAEGELVRSQADHDRRHALLRRAAQINDDVVQAMVVAKLATAAGRDQQGAAALDVAIKRASRIATELMTEGRSVGEIRPGDLRRDRR